MNNSLYDAYVHLQVAWDRAKHDAAELERLRAENERMRAALVEAMIVPEAFMISGRPAHMRDDVWGQMQRSVEIARAALAEQTKGNE